jgi:hypothetical protein
VLVAYSDGLVERRGTVSGEQLALLTRIVARACDPERAGTADSIAVEVLEALVPDHDRAEDDVCVLVARRQPWRRSARSRSCASATTRSSTAGMDPAVDDGSHRQLVGVVGFTGRCEMATVGASPWPWRPPLLG